MIDVTYYSYLPSRADQAWTQPDCFDSFLASCAVDASYTKAGLVEEMRIFNLERGSVSNDSGFEEYPDDVLGALYRASGLGIFDYEHPSAADLVALYEVLTPERITQAAEALDYYDPTENKRAVMDFLKNVRSVAVDLKENPGAVFIIAYHGNETVPASLGSLLHSRAEELVEFFWPQLTQRVRVKD